MEFVTMNNKVILITGSSRGIGACCARKFAEKGYSVIINYANSKSEAEQLVSLIHRETDNTNVMAIQADVGFRDDVNRMFDQIYNKFDICDVLINMAGINKDRAFLDMDSDSWDAVINTILTGTFNCCQEFALRFPGDHGHIVNIGAVTGIRGRKNGVNYCSARAGVMNLTRCLALELAPGISVNTVTPGYIGTEEVITRHSLHIQENYHKTVSGIPFGKLGEPEDVYNTISFLIDSSSYITGQNIMVDGGYFMM
jgi:acetoacetyl-CoA reductase/3-oxoacyl-[acyl-carrier protein] reductase